MLDRFQFLKALENCSTLFIDASEDQDRAKQIWDILVKDKNFKDKIPSSSSIPTWYEDLNASYFCYDIPKQYTIMAVDGSQIYPDRHQGTSCFLINIGTITIQYGLPNPVSFSTKPFVFGEDQEHFYLQEEYIDALRHGFELRQGIETFLEKNTNSAGPKLLLFDGALLFWHLEKHDMRTQEKFTAHYSALLLECAKQRIPVAWYISYPKNKDLVQLLELAGQHYKIDFQLEKLYDANIGKFFLKEYCFSQIFKSNVSLTQRYPEEIHPHFVYCNTGQEIARIEMPAWLVNDKDLLKTTLNIIADQLNKGKGYPIVLAEAHEQAVIKGADRDFFYHMIQKIALKDSRLIHLSAKSVRKRGIGI